MATRTQKQRDQWTYFNKLGEITSLNRWVELKVENIIRNNPQFPSDIIQDLRYFGTRFRDTLETAEAFVKTQYLQEKSHGNRNESDD